MGDRLNFVTCEQTFVRFHLRFSSWWCNSCSCADTPSVSRAWCSGRRLVSDGLVMRRSNCGLFRMKEVLGGAGRAGRLARFMLRVDEAGECW